MRPVAEITANQFWDVPASRRKRGKLRPSTNQPLRSSF
jgi:hypothetical protein